MSGLNLKNQGNESMDHAPMNDLFISYAHLDDQSLEEDQKGWISKFHRVLEVKISQLMGEQPTIWRDLKLGGNDVFDDKIVQEFKQARVMISVLSPRYVKSEWCRKELNEYYDSASHGEGVKVGDKSRIIKVIKTPFDSGEAMQMLPKLFEGLLGFEFYETDPDSGRIIEFDEAFGAKAKQNYYSRIYDLASEVADLLKIIRSGGKLSTAFQEPEATIYLATCTSDLQPVREKLSREFKERGYKVLPDQVLPSEFGEVKEMVANYLRDCDYAIHIVGKRYGVIPEDAQHSLAEIQNELSASEKAQRPSLSRFVWMERGLMSEDIRQQQFIQNLQENAEILAGAELIEDSLDVFRDCVIQTIKERKQIEVSSPDSQQISKANSSVYLIYDPIDEESVCELEDFLFDEGLEVMIPTLEGDEALVKSAHIEKMIHCDGVLVFYGQSDRSWVDMKLMNLMKAPGYGRTEPFKATAVYLAPPFEKRKGRYRTHQAVVIKQEGEKIDPSSLASFITALKN